MIDVYEIKFEDNENCVVKMCKEDELGKEIQESTVCLRYKETWESTISEHITGFFNKHQSIKTFEETKDIIRGLMVYKFVTEDGSRMTIDATPRIKNMEAIKKAKKQI